MDEFKKISGSEWGAPYSGASTDPLSSIAQRHKDGNHDASLAAVLSATNNSRAFSHLPLT
jgi:hypothetical protein